MMRGIGNVLVVLAVIAAVGFGVVAAIRSVFGGLFEGLSSGKLADLATLAVVFIVGVVLVVRSGDWVGALIWRGRTSQPKQDAPVIEGEWRPAELSGYRAPVAQLPAPRVVSVPRMNVNGTARPMGVPTPETVLTTAADDSEGKQTTLTIPIRYLYRFAKCPTPARSEWTGKPGVFYEAQRFFDSHGFMEPNGTTKVWRECYPIRARMDWLEQFEPHTGAGKTTTLPQDDREHFAQGDDR